VIYGGWTVYAAGDHFVGGELTVVGDPYYPGRAERLLGLLTDRGFGLIAWAPVYLAAIPALAALLRRRPPGTDLLILPLAAGWLNATFVALTMHGWWWPGRQVVVVLPCAVLAVAWWVGGLVREGRLARPRQLAPWLAATAFGLVAWAWLVVEASTDVRTLIVDFEQTADPLVRAWRMVLPDLRSETARTGVLGAAWFVVAAVLAWWGWRTAPRSLLGLALGDEDAGRGEGADAHVAALDLDGGGAVG
jgi:hypothetical protein